MLDFTIGAVTQSCTARSSDVGGGKKGERGKTLGRRRRKIIQKAAVDEGSTVYVDLLSLYK